MKKKITRIALLSLFVMPLMVNAQGFSTTATNWTLPAGGYRDDNGHLYGFNQQYKETYYYNGAQGWSTMDINGDGKQDLVVTGQGNGSFGDGFGLPNNPVWKVYLNTGSGFSTTASNWTLPAGGYKDDNGHLYGFNQTSKETYYYNGAQGWSTMDMNGDGKPDLVVTGQGNGSFGDGFGLPNNPVWKVYLNTGSGFSTTAANWALPAGGYKDDNGHLYGFNETFKATYYYNGAQGWSTIDVSGDGKPDLVVTGQGNGSFGDGFGLPNSPVWKVYLNTGSGFSATATNWGLPGGGYKDDNGHLYGFNEISKATYYYNGAQGWSTKDMNGDEKPDLVVTGQGNGSFGDGFGLPNNPVWKVYLNTGSGFSTTVTNWSLPAGGYKDDNGHLYGFNEASKATYYYNGAQGWSSDDINGDGKPDLIVTGQGNGSFGDGFGLPNNPVWKVYLNTGSGFSASVISWTLPAGGYRDDNGHLYGFNETSKETYYYNGAQGWSANDINGDGKMDLIVTGQGNGSFGDGFGLPGNPVWKVYLSTSTLEVDAIESASVEIKVFPNPVNELLYIQSDNELVNETYRITDNLGRVLSEGTLSGNINAVDVSNMQSGVLYVQFGTGSKEAIKVVKQ
ncbi:MAG: cell surface protein [Crocinitomicaceae bacterium]|jgi:hypothetical protein|nr:cell surface protein [Crocinitomicaceae bacterium]